MEDEHITICEKCGGDRVFSMDSWLGECKKCNKLNLKSGIIDDIIKQVDKTFKGEKHNE